MSHALALSPSGQLFVVPDEQAEPKLGLTDATRLIEAFAASSARGLELLASAFLQEPAIDVCLLARACPALFHCAVPQPESGDRRRVERSRSPSGGVGHPGGGGATQEGLGVSERRRPRSVVGGTGYSHACGHRA